MNRSGYLIIACAAMAALGIGFSMIHFRGPPSDLARVQGAVVSKQCMAGKRGGIEVVEFEIAGSAQKYRYSSLLPRVRELCERMRPGMDMALLYASPGEPELWAALRDRLTHPR